MRKCTFRWLSHKRRRFGNRTHYDNRDHKCTRDKVDGNGTQRSQAGKYTRQSRDGICKKSIGDSLMIEEIFMVFFNIFDKKKRIHNSVFI